MNVFVFTYGSFVSVMCVIEANKMLSLFGVDLGILIHLDDN